MVTNPNHTNALTNMSLTQSSRIFEVPLMHQHCVGSTFFTLKNFEEMCYTSHQGSLSYLKHCICFRTVTNVLVVCQLTHFTGQMTHELNVDVLTNTLVGCICRGRYVWPGKRRQCSPVIGAFA